MPRLTIWLGALALCYFGMSFIPQAFFQGFADISGASRVSQAFAKSSSEMLETAISREEVLPVYDADFSGAPEMLRWVAVIWLLNASLAYLANLDAVKRRNLHIFPFAVAVSFVIFLIGYRSVINAGFGFESESSTQRISTGILFNPTDNLVYLSGVANSKHGAVLHDTLQNMEENPPVFFNIFYSTLGLIADWADVPVFAVFHLAGTLSVLIAIPCVYRLGLSVGFSVNASRWAVLLAAFSSGLTIPVALGCLVTGSPVLLGADVGFPQAIGFPTFCVYPLHACAHTALIVAVLLAVECERERKGRFRWAALMVVSLLATAIHAYEGVVLFGAYGLYFLASCRSARILRRFFIGATVAVGVLPLTGYHYWVSLQAAFQTGAGQAVVQHYSPGFWLIGYGAILPFTLLGCWAAFRHPEFGRARFPAVWSLMIFVALIVMNISQSAIANGAYLLMCVPAGYAWERLVKQIHSFESPLSRASAYAAAVATGLLMLSTNFSLLTFACRANFYDAELKQIGELLRDQASEQNPSVLCDPVTASYLSAIAAVRVYASNWSATSHYQDKRKTLILAGFIPTKSGTASREHFQHLLEQTRTEYVVMPSNTVAAQYARECQSLKLLKEFERWRVYQAR